MSDLRSESRPFKRDKDRSEKWSYGARPLPGIRVDYNASTLEEELVGGTEAARQKSRPRAPWSHEPKSHSTNHTKVNGRHSYDTGRSSARVVSKINAVVDANEAANAKLSQSLLDLMPQHTNNTSSALQTALRATASDGEVLFSFDSRGPSPGDKGRLTDLGGLVEKAQQQWDSKQTEKIVKGEYEILDNDGETTILGKKKKGSPKQRAAKHPKNASHLVAAEDEDGFELV